MGFILIAHQQQELVLAMLVLSGLKLLAQQTPHASN